jgi:hypothetical protein
MIDQTHYNSDILRIKKNYSIIVIKSSTKKKLKDVDMYWNRN